MVKVYNKRHGDAPADAIYIGRPTRYGNRYTHLKDRKTQASVVVDSLEECIRKYFRDLVVLYLDEERWEPFAAPLRGKDLVCWCAPKGGLDVGFGPQVICHGQLLGALVLLDDSAMRSALTTFIDKDKLLHED